jgi:glycosyltransferase involved in cell wall biosynthesis
MPLRIVHVTNEAFGLEAANGVQHAVYCLAGAQAGIGESVAMFTRDDHAVHVLSEHLESRRRPPEMVSARSGNSLRERLLSRHFEQVLAEDILAWQPDIVHFHSVHIPQNVALAAHLRRARVPYCVTVHAGLFRAALRRRRLKKAVFNLFFERRYLNEAQFIHALSPHESEVIRRHGVKRPVVVVPNGLPPDVDVPASQPDALYAALPWLRDQHVFMFIGRLDSWQKGLDLLVNAFARAGLRDAALVLVGPDYRGSRRALTTLTGRLGISSRVVFVDAAFGPDRANLFAAADVFVHPSRWEGVSLSVLAAAAAGKACLITREADPLGELERAQAAIIVEASVSSVAEGLKRATALSRQELQVIGARARRVADAHFTWPAIAGKLIDAYRLALNHLYEHSLVNQRFPASN